MELTVFKAPWSHLKLHIPQRWHVRDDATPWSRLAHLLDGPRHNVITLDTLQSFIRLALHGHIPQHDVRATADAMLDDLIWRHREKHGPARPTMGNLRDICQEAHEIERRGAT